MVQWEHNPKTGKVERVGLAPGQTGGQVGGEYVYRPSGSDPSTVYYTKPEKKVKNVYRDVKSGKPISPEEAIRRGYESGWRVGDGGKERYFTTETEATLYLNEQETRQRAVLEEQRRKAEAYALKESELSRRSRQMLRSTEPKYYGVQRASKAISVVPYVKGQTFQKHGAFKKILGDKEIEIKPDHVYRQDIFGSTVEREGTFNLTVTDETVKKYKAQKTAEFIGSLGVMGLTFFAPISGLPKGSPRFKTKLPKMTRGKPTTPFPKQTTETPATLSIKGKMPRSPTEFKQVSTQLKIIENNLKPTPRAKLPKSPDEFKNAVSGIRVIDLADEYRHVVRGGGKGRTATIQIQKTKQIQKQKVETLTLPKTKSIKKAQLQRTTRQLFMSQIAIPKTKVTGLSSTKFKQELARLTKTTTKQTPAQIPRQTPKQTPRQKPAQIPRQTPKQTPRQKPAQIPRQIPKQTPAQKAKPKQALKQTTRTVQRTQLVPKKFKASIDRYRKKKGKKKHGLYVWSIKNPVPTLESLLGVR